MSHYQRKIEQNHPASSQLLTPDDLAGLDKEPADWLVKQAQQHKLGDPCYLLAHADDGVIWGRLDGNALATSHQALAKAQAREKWDGPRLAAARHTLAELRPTTLQQARLFSAQGELLVWRDGDGRWQGRLISNAPNDQAANWSDSFDEPQLLWGTHGTHLADKFTLLEDGAQGLRHAVPCKLKLDDKDFGQTTPPRLTVRHYLDYDKQGQAYIAVSRLVTLEK